MVALVILLCLALPDLVEAELREARTPAGPESATEASDTIPAIVTDRPDVTDAATVVPRGSLLLENGVTFTRDHGNPILDGPQSLIRFGLTSRTELRLGVPDYVAALGASPGGFGDSSVGFKQQLGPWLGQVELAVIAGVSLPTGARDVSSGGYDPFVKLPWSLELGRSWSIGGMLSFFWLTETGRRNPTGQPAFYIERQLTKPWDVFIEYAADYPVHGGPRPILHAGTAYRITPRNQVDLHIGLGVSRAAPDFFVGIGYSFRLDHLLDAPPGRMR
jgi:Putative MetA-pathway of phenol degradation